MQKLIDIQEAKFMAEKLREMLEPFCLEGKCVIGGSIRREKMEIKDIEIIVLPKLEKVVVMPNVGQLDMFAPVPTPTSEIRRVEGFCQTIFDFGDIAKGDPRTGRYVQVVHDRKVNVDIFIPEPKDFGRQLAIRTGPAMYSKDILATAWAKKALCGTDSGLRLRNQCTKAVSKTTHKKYGPYFVRPDIVNAWEAPSFETEEDFFEFLGIEWIEPRERWAPYNPYKR